MVYCCSKKCYIAFSKVMYHAPLLQRFTWLPPYRRGFPPSPPLPTNSHLTSQMFGSLLVCGCMYSLFWCGLLGLFQEIGKYSQVVEKQEIKTRRSEHFAVFVSPRCKTVYNGLFSWGETIHRPGWKKRSTAFWWRSTRF